MSMKIVIFETVEREKQFFTEQLRDFSVQLVHEPLRVENAEQYADAEIISIMANSELKKETLERMPKLRYITTRSTGFDHIDIAYCSSKGIQVSNVPTYGDITVAEHAFALILTIAKKILPSVRRTRQGNFSLDGLTGFDLEGKTIGIIGAGHIGRAAIRIAKGFQMNILVYSRKQDRQLAQELGFSYVPLEELLGKSDIVSLHVPYTKETHHMINKTNIHDFKKGSILINTARGGVVETEAIVTGLETGILAAAGLDVLEEECYIKEEQQLLTSEFLKECDIKTQLLNHVLLTKENAVITPHNAFNTVEALQRILETTVANITDFMENRPHNLVAYEG